MPGLCFFPIKKMNIYKLLRYKERFSHCDKYDYSLKLPLSLGPSLNKNSLLLPKGRCIEKGTKFLLSQMYGNK